MKVVLLEGLKINYKRVELQSIEYKFLKIQIKGIAVIQIF